MTETNSLVVLPGVDLPDRRANRSAAEKANIDALNGISTGMPARVKMNGKQFMLVDGNGVEKPFPNAQLIPGPDGNLYMPLIMLRACGPLQKQWYAAAYNPSQEGVAPDCFSIDSIKPHPSSASKQSETCANCPHNAFGTGRDNSGNATKGKACSDNKVLAVFVPGFGIHSLKIPPASLKNFGLYVKQLTSAGCSLSESKTLVSFDATASFPVLIFAFGGIVPDASLPKLQELSESPEVAEIISPNIVAAAPKAVETPAAQPAPVQQPAAAAQPTVTVDLGLDKPAPAAPAQPAPAAASVPTDEQLMKELGL